VNTQLDVAALAIQLDALAQAAQLVAQHLRSGLAEIGDGEPHGNGKPMAPSGDLLDANELAALMKIEIRTLRRWRQEGRAPKPLKGKGPLRWSRTSVETWLDERKP